jgi:tetratricopeptide (TPR) repeat protein
MNLWIHASTQTAERCWAAGLGHVGEAYRRSGRPQEALRWYRESLRLEPALGAVAAHLLLARKAAEPATPAPTVSEDFVERFPDVAQELELVVSASSSVAEGGPRTGASSVPNFDLFTDADLGLLAPRRAEISRAFASFAVRNWDSGFKQLARPDSASQPERVKALDAFCASRPGTCGPWRAAQEQVRRLERKALHEFEAGGSSEALRDWNSLLAWMPSDDAGLAGRQAVLFNKSSNGLDLYSDAELGPLAPRRSALKSAFEAFAARDWGEGFRRLRSATDGFSAARMGALSSFCSRRPGTCAPWEAAQLAVKGLNDEGIRAFQAGDRARARRIFDGIRVWMPTEPSTLVNRAAAASADGNDALALTLYDSAMKLTYEPASYQAEVLTARAAVLARMGRVREARRDIAAALRKAPVSWARRTEALAEISRLGRTDSKP